MGHRLNFVVPRVSGQLQGFQIEVVGDPGAALVIEFNGLQGNLPETYGNNAALWLGALPNPAAKPLETQPASNNGQPGNIAFKTTIGPSAYSVTYQLGPCPETMCALAQINVSGFQSPRNVSMQIKEITTNSLTLLYGTLAGYTPRKYRNWVGLWQGFALPYTAGRPLGRVAVASDASQAQLTLTNLELSRQFEYTLIYFVGPKREHAAAAIWFRTTDTIAP